MFEIRFANKNDRNKLRKLVINMIGDSNPKKVARKVVDEFYNDKRYVTFVILKQKKVVGFGVLKKGSFEGANKVAEIVWLGIDKQYRRKGLGKKLVSKLEEYAKEEDIRKLYIKTSPKNKSAVCFWVMNNYQFEARMLDFSLNGLDDYYFGKKI